MPIAKEANSGGRHPAVLTSDANAADRPLCVVDANCGGSHPAVPALDAEILTAVRALNRYPKRGKAQAENLLAKRIAKDGQTCFLAQEKSYKLCKSPSKKSYKVAWYKKC